MFELVSDQDVTAAFTCQSQASKALGIVGVWPKQTEEGQNQTTSPEEHRGTVTRLHSKGAKVRSIYRMDGSLYCRLLRDSTSLRGRHIINKADNKLHIAAINLLRYQLMSMFLSVQYIVKPTIPLLHPGLCPWWPRS